MVNGELPDGWQMTTLGEATKPMQKRVNPQDYPDLPYIGMENVEAHSMRLLGTVPSKEMKSAADTFSAGDVLYGRLRPYLNKVYLPDFDGLCSTEFIVFRKVSHLYSKYLQYFLNSWEFVQFANSLNAGDRPRVKFDQLADYAFPVPPLPEQERIVAKIEELFTQLDAGTSALAKVQAGLRRYKASVLKAGMNGTLFGNGRYNDKLPEGWQSVQLAAVLSEPLSNGRSTPNAEEGFPVLRLTALKDGRIDLQERKIGAWTKEQAKNYLVKQGDFFVSRGNGSLHLVGRGGLVEQEPDDVAYPDTLIRIRVSPADCDIKYLRTIWNSNFIRNQVETTARTTAGIYKINQKDLEGFTFPLPPLEEQRRIVAEVERRLSVAREVESVVEKALVRASRLRQAVLKSAFEGRLVNGL